MNIKKITAIIAALAVSVTAVSVTVFAAGTKVPITEKYFPDEVFREYVSENFDADGNGFLSQKERDAVTKISVSEMKIKSLKGLQYFKNLEYLYCDNNDIAELDVSKNTKLECIQCYNNKLTKLDLSKNTQLKALDCGCNQLTKLDVSKCTELKELYCEENQLTELDLSGCTELMYYECDENVKIIK